MLDNLRHTISDQNLELIPDYEQRLDVLRELRFIDGNSTVLLKGRVACEVRPVTDPFLEFDTLTTRRGIVIFRLTLPTRSC